MLNYSVKLPHLTFTTSPLYRGYPVITNHGPLVEGYLDTSYQTLYKALADHPRTVAIRVDLKFPIQGRVNDHDFLGRDMPLLMKDFQEGAISNFFRSLDYLIQRDTQKRRRQRNRAEPCRVRYIWACEFSNHDHLHYRVVILLNGDAYRSLGPVDSKDSYLSGMIRQAWIKILNLDMNIHGGLVHFPRNPVCYVNSRNDEDKFFRDFGSLFYRVSYFAKFVIKQWGTGFRCFGSSRR